MKILLLSLFTVCNLGNCDEINSENAKRRKELEIPLPERKLYSGWAAWSEWSGCSRSCGSGVKHQLRRCLGKRCSGRSVRYEICKSQDCPAGTLDFRATQCAFYDKKPYRDYIYDKWSPVENEKEPCSLICKAKSYKFSVKFAPKVQDGTLCRNSSKDVCIDGKCLKVGCDHVIGSGKTMDDCGVCGGNGSTCSRPVFIWKQTKKFSECDKTCGPERWRVSISVCQNQKTNRIVPEKFCADKARPRPKIEKCPYIICPAEWLVGEWEDCDATCGGGWQKRTVYCAERHNSSKGEMENRKVPEKYCWQAKKPVMGRKCSSHHCPIWESAEWSQCSVTCGKGVKTRRVACRQERYQNLDHFACDPKKKPNAKLVCLTGISCKDAEANKVADYERYRYVASAPYTQWSDDRGYSGSGNGLMPKPHFMPSQWSDCSTTCGSGVRTRKVDCVASQGITGNIMRLPDYECEGQARPADFQPCELRQCPQSSPYHETQQSFKSEHDTVREYRWEYGLWGPCSASCLGGKQKSTLKCVDVHRGKPVAWSYCDPKQRPIDVTRTCNNQPCLPRWDVGSWSVCSHTCGGGIRTRRARCIREIAKNGGAESTLILPDIQCGNNKPRDREPCGLADCPVQWHIEHWDSCSATCGAGEQHRLVFCERRTADGKLRRFNPPTECQELAKPPSVQLCDLGPCPGDFAKPKEKPNKVKNESKEDKNNKGKTKDKGSKAFIMRVGDRARLFEGMSVKIKCPVRNFNRSKIQWTKDGRIIKPGGRVKISRFGALRIFKAQKEDEGTYACIAGGVRGSATIAFKPHEAVYPDSEGSTVEVPAPESMVKATTETEEEITTGAQQVKAQAEAGEKSELDYGSDPRKLPILKLKEFLLRKNELKLYEALKDVNSANQLKVHWLNGSWSPCSQSCGATEGMQFRQVQCRVEIKGLSEYVDNSLCTEFGVSKPHETQLCPVLDCPRWDSSEWTKCEESRCIRFSTSLQRREVFCVWPNNTKTEKPKCSRKSRPRTKTECFNRDCLAAWRASSWGPCSISCGEGGVQMRVIRCVWNGTRRAAGSQCQGADRPKVMRPCKNLRSCSGEPQPEAQGPFKDDPDCQEESRFCQMVNVLKKCHEAEYKRRCCLTCTYLYEVTPA